MNLDTGSVYLTGERASVGIEKVLFITKTNSDKVKAIRKCEKSCIECYADESIVWLWGNIEIIKDFEKIRLILSEKYWE